MDIEDNLYIFLFDLEHLLGLVMGNVELLLRHSNQEYVHQITPILEEQQILPLMSFNILGRSR